MRSRGGREKGSVCGCVGNTVFEGAVIGQVFTGDVQIKCRAGVCHLEPHRGSSLPTVLLSVAIWQAALAFPPDPVQPGRHAVAAVALLLAAAVVQFAGSAWMRRRSRQSWSHAQRRASRVSHTCCSHLESQGMEPCNDQSTVCTSNSNCLHSSIQ